MNFFIFALLLCVVHVNCLSDEDTSVELLQIVFRHGDRTPVQNYPLDPHNETIWAKYGGYGQLTQLGMRQHFEYGQFLRNRYSFLDKIYSRNRVNVISTDFDRTIMSAQSLLSGLFEPVDYQKWSKDMNWQPIPVHTTDAKNDKVFYSNDCPRYNELKNEVAQSQEYTELNKKYKDLFEIIDGKAGFETMNLMDLWKIGDVIKIEKSYGFELPDWAERNFDQIIDSLGWGFYFDYRLPEMAKLTAGPILREIKNNILRKVNNKSPNELFLFSSHDTYVAALTKLLNITETINQPPYASSVLLELRSSNMDPSKHFIKVYLKNNTASEDINLRPLPIYGCDLLCPLDNFLNIAKDMVVEDITKACKSQKYGTYSHATLVAAITFVTTVSIVLIVLTVLSCRTLTNKYQYQHNPL